jgi:tetratricopeptide (TPR) repeat protein
MKQFALGLLTIFILTGNAWAEKIMITSNPSDAEVNILNNLTGKKIKIGKTPFESSVGEVLSNFGGGNVFMLEVGKEGFQPFRLLVARSGKNDLELIVNLPVDKEIEQVQSVDKLVAELFDVQRLLRGKAYQGALKKLEELEKSHPHYSVIYEIKASAYYLKKDFKNSLAMYRKAFGLNPENYDAYRMKLYLEKKYGLGGAKSAAGK